MADQGETLDQVRERLEELWGRLDSRSKSISENHIDQYTESIAKEIFNGDLELANHSQEVKNIRNKHDIQSLVKEELLRKAQRQKRILENKLIYLSQSISGLKGSDSPREMSNTARYDQEGQMPKIDLKERAMQFKKEMLERERKLEALKKEAKLRQQLKQNEQKSLEQQKKKEQYEQRKRQINESIKKIKERMEKREMESKQANQKIRNLIENQKMYERLESSFHIKQTSLLEQRKRKLSEIRNLYRPLDHEQLAHHEQRFLESQREKQELRERQRKMNAQRNYEVPYESVFYKRLKEKQEQEDPVESEKAKIQKIKSFAQHVKDNFRPQVDPNKKKQIQELLRKQKQQTAKRQQRQKELLDKAKKKGLQYLEQLKNMPRPPVLPKATTSPRAQSTPRTEYKNYITHSEQTSNPWKRILDSSHDTADKKAMKIYFESIKIQESLKRKEEIHRLAKKGDSQEIDQGYYEMIKAKLKVLQDK